MKPIFNLKKTSPVAVQHLNHPFLSMTSDFDRRLGDFYNLFNAPQFSLENFEALNITPSVDIVDSKESFKVEIEMPGVGEENVKVAVCDGLLTVKAEKSTSKQDKNKNYMMREIGYGCYERTIPLPDSVDTDKAKASFKKGMLWIDIPKKAEAAKHYREVKVQAVSEREKH